MKHPARLVFAVTLLGLLALPAQAEEEDDGMWARLKRFDKDGDGKVTREEFGRSGRMFDRLDTDGDGAISKKEAAAMPARGGRGGRGGMQGIPPEGVKSTVSGCCPGCRLPLVGVYSPRERRRCPRTSPSLHSTS